MTYTLLMIGCGNMGGALLSGWREAGLVNRAVIVKPSLAAPLNDPAVTFVSTPAEIPAAFTPDMVILAVKPQTLTEILPLYRHYAPATPFLSIAAGKTLGYFATHFGPDAAVIRTMPNLPATVRRGVTGCVASDTVSRTHRDMATALMQAVGTVHWIEEAQIDALTAVSGSGPAYVFLLQEAMQKAGEALGLDAHLAASLARETITGTGVLLGGSPEDATLLRQRVTSKAGVTEAAIAILQQNDAMGELFKNALAAAAKRAGELAE
jgi:pyrroline-5-carboxylate reductase